MKREIQNFGQRKRALGETESIFLFLKWIFINQINLMCLEVLLDIHFKYHETQSNLEEKVNPSILKNDFSSRTEPSIFTSTAAVLIDWSNETSIEINNPLPVPVHGVW